MLIADREGSRYLSVLIRAAQKAHLRGRSRPRGDEGIPLHPKKVRSKWDAFASEISRQQGVALTGAGVFFAIRTNKRGKLVADSLSLEVIESRQDVVLDRLLESKTQVIGLNARGIG